ncbi:MAG: phosphatidylserine decarboxylase family protein [Candidatus Aminicenantia bacterium]
MPIAKEGIPYIATPFLLTILSLIFSIIPLSLIFFLISIFMIFFFRDPRRKPVCKENQILSPADGKIVEIEEKEDEILPGKRLFKISIFMSPFNVHINRVPVNGKVEKIIYRPGFFKPAYKENSSKNEQNIILINTAKYSVIMKQIAGILARRVICKLKENQEIKAGEKAGMIIFGSRVELFFEKEPRVAIKIGDKVKSGETIIGEFDD